MTIPSGSDPYIVDSSGWVEYLSDGPKAGSFAPYLERSDRLLVPTIIVYEVYKKLLRERGAGLAAQFLSQSYGYEDSVIQLDIPLASLAAELSIESRLPMADAIIYATARVHGAELVTTDAHFSGLPGVTLV